MSVGADDARPARPERVDERQAGHPDPFFPEIDLLHAQRVMIHEERVVADDERGVTLAEHPGDIGRHLNQRRLDGEPARAQHAQKRDGRSRAHIERYRSDALGRNFRKNRHRGDRAVGRDRQIRNDSIVATGILDRRNQAEIDGIGVQQLCALRAARRTAA